MVHFLLSVPPTASGTPLEPSLLEPLPKARLAGPQPGRASLHPRREPAAEQGQPGEEPRQGQQPARSARNEKENNILQQTKPTILDLNLPKVQDVEI